MKTSSVFAMTLFAMAVSVAQSGWTVIKCSTLIDVRTGITLTDVFVLVEGKTVRKVGSDLKLPHEARIIDLSGLTVMPGLIDAHTHIVVSSGPELKRKTSGYLAIHATANARSTLMAGITTVRDVGNGDASGADVALRDAIDDGVVRGPRILASIMPVGATPSHSPGGFHPCPTVTSRRYEAHGPKGMRRLVSRLVGEGADQIMVYVESDDGKGPGTGLKGGAVRLSIEELNAVVAEAHRSGKKVAAQVQTDAGAHRAIDANVNSIEQGVHLSEETFRQMAKKSIFYVPTLGVLTRWADSTGQRPLTPDQEVRLEDARTAHVETFKRALRTPVGIVCGSGTFGPVESSARELELMVAYGMSPIDAIRSATVAAAELLGIEATTGTIEANKIADIIAVEGNPLKNMADLRRVAFVMKAGTVHVSRER